MFSLTLRSPGDHTEQPVRFRSDQLVTAILYHVSDEQMAESFDEPSVRSTLARLEADGVSGSMERRFWRSMTNAQRLRWLLSRAQTTIVLDESGTATLKPMQSGWPTLFVARARRSAFESDVAGGSGE